MKFVIFKMELSHLMQTVVNPTIANSECFLKMHKADFVQKFVVNLLGGWSIYFSGHSNPQIFPEIFSQFSVFLTFSALGS